MKKRIATILMVCAALAASGAQAQVEEGLQYSITPYLWAMGLEGSIQAGAVGGDVDVGFSDLLDNLEMTVPIRFEASGPVWTLIAEINFADLSYDLEGSNGMTIGELDLDMLTAELLSGYKFSDFSELIFGVRYTSLDTELSFGGGPGGSSKFSADQDWVDPVVGLRYGGPISRRWNFRIRGDVGGFGVGSELTWNLRAGFGVEVSDVTQIVIGYHVLDIDYDQNNFVYDMAQQGPEFAVSFKW